MKDSLRLAQVCWLLGLLVLSGTSCGSRPLIYGDLLYYDLKISRAGTGYVDLFILRREMTIHFGEFIIQAPKPEARPEYAKLEVYGSGLLGKGAHSARHVPRGNTLTAPLGLEVVRRFRVSEGHQELLFQLRSPYDAQQDELTTVALAVDVKQDAVTPVFVGSLTHFRVLPPVSVANTDKRLAAFDAAYADDLWLSRFYAVYLMGETGGEEVVTRLAHAAKSDPVWDVRVQALVSLLRLQTRAGMGVPVDLRDLLQDPDELIRVEAAAAALKLSQGVAPIYLRPHGDTPERPFRLSGGPVSEAELPFLKTLESALRHIDSAEIDRQLLAEEGGAPWKINPAFVAALAVDHVSQYVSPATLQMLKGYLGKLENRPCSNMRLWQKSDRWSVVEWLLDERISQLERAIRGG